MCSSLEGQSLFPYRICGAVMPPGGGATPGLPPDGGGICMEPGSCSGLMPGSLPLIALPSETQDDSLQQEISPVALSHMNENDPPWACALSAMFRQAWAPEGFLAASWLNLSADMEQADALFDGLLGAP